MNMKEASASFFVVIKKRLKRYDNSRKALSLHRVAFGKNCHAFEVFSEP